MDMMDKVSKQYRDVFYIIFRILVGVLFFMHGYSKFAGGMAAGLFLVAAIVELVVGAALILGFFVRWASFFGAGQMLIAYVMVHAPKGLSPLDNGGELAVIYFAAFCVAFIYGNGKWGLQKSG